MKNNLFNRIFHRRKLKEYKEKRELAKTILFHADAILSGIKEAKTLERLLTLHKYAWSLGIRNVNIGPCLHGKFRTSSISTMTVDDVYLGGIFGLVTENIRFWNKFPNETMAGNCFGIPDETKIYDLLMNQYRKLLESNILAIKEENARFLFCK